MMNRYETALKCMASLGLCLGLFARTSLGQQPEVSVYDTVVTPAAVLSGEALAKKEGWVKIPEGKKTSVKGGAVLVNSSMTVVLRLKSDGADVYGTGTNGSILRAHIVPIGDADGMTLTSVNAVSAADAASVEAVYKSGKGTALKVTYSLEPPNPILKTQPGAGVVGQRVAAPSRLGVLPDFFAADMVIDARAIPIDKTEIPAENFFMQMLGNGEAILTTIWNRSNRDVEITLAGEKEARQITAVDVYYGEAEASKPAAATAVPPSIWLALQENKGVWVQAELTPENATKVTTLDWAVPFRAKWKGDFICTDNSVDSRGFDEPRGKSPCWFDGKDNARKGFIQAATTNVKLFVAYPSDRITETPGNQLTITDLMRNSLGKGPCEYIMDVAGAANRNRGIFTCAFNAIILPLFAGGRQKEELVFIDRGIKEVQIFVAAIRDRINAYVEFRAEMLKYLAEQKTVHPELAEFIGRLEAQTRKIQETKVDSSEPVAKLCAQIKAEAISDMPRRDMESLTAEGYGGIADYGEAQDQKVARCNIMTRMLRQMATIETAMNPKAAELAKEIRKRTEQMLRSPLSHEPM